MTPSRRRLSSPLLLGTVLMTFLEASMSTEFNFGIPDGIVLCNPDNSFDEDLLNFLPSSEDPFCMNGGKCRKNYARNPDFPCRCPEGMTGPHCEFIEGEEPECNLECFNDGVCQQGFRTWTASLYTFSDDQQNYCRCPEGFYGNQCEIDGRQCGSTHCLNGGQCVEIEQDDGSTTDHCDCSTAIDDQGRGYAGRYCEVQSTSRCSDHDPINPMNFCANGGVCHAESWRGCECPVDFVGTMCEFQKRDDEPYICNMQCANGFCRHGAKDTSWLEEFDFGTRHRHLTQRFDQEFEHCQCPPGWVGLHCDFKVNVCPGQTHVCLNGGICVFDETTDFDYKCDCSHAHDDGQKYAGDYCQYEATSYCTFDGKQPQGDAFCTNDGICRDFVAHDDTHPGCFCLEGFEGPHCEQLVPPPVRSSSEGKSGDQDWIWLVIVVLSFLGIILIIIMWIMDRRRRLHRMFKANATDGPYGIYPEKDLDMVPYKDVPSLENSLDEDVFEDEISRDKVDNRSPVFEPSDGLFMDSDSHSKGSSRTSSLYSKGSSKRSKGSSKRSNNSSTHTPDTYSLTVQEKDYFKDLEMAGLAPLGGARLVSEIPPTVNDDQFNPSEYANCDYSLDSSTMRNMQLVPVDSSEYQDTYGLGTFNEEKASNDDIKIQQKSSADSGFSSGVDSMSTMESEITGIGEDETKRRAKSRKKYIQGKHSKVPGAESAESSLEGENIVLSEDYALERHISGISHDKDPVVLTGVSQEGSNFVLMSQASALAGTVLDDSDSSHVSDTSAYMSEQGLTGVQVLREPSEHGSIKSLRSDSKCSLSSKGVRFDEKSQASKGSKSSSGSTRASVRSDNRRSTRGDKALSKGANDSNKTVKDDDARSEKSSGGKHSSSSASPAPEVKIRSSHEDNDGSVKSTSARSGRSSNAVVPDYDDSLHESKRKPSNVSSGDSKKSSSSRKSRGSNADQKKSDKPSQKSVDDEGDSVGNSTVSSGLGFWVFGG